MRITVSDIHAARDFAESLERTCDEMLEGEPRSQALGREGIGQSVFITLIRGLRKSTDTGENGYAADIDDLRAPAWEDDLIYDITGEEYVYLAPDFEEALHDISGRVLTEDESAVIRLLYPKRKTYEMAAQELGVSELTVRTRQKRALKKLKGAADELCVGEEYTNHLGQLRQGQDRYYTELDWMEEALEFLHGVGDDADTKLSDLPVSQEAITYFRHNGLGLLSEVIDHPLSELFTRICDRAGEEGAFLAAVRSDDEFSLDAAPDESIGIDPRSAAAFREAGIHTVRQFLALSRDEAFSIKGIGPKTIVYIYRRVLFG